MSDYSELKLRIEGHEGRGDTKCVMDVHAMRHLIDQIDQLKTENGRLKADYAQLSTFNPDWDRVAAAQDTVREHIAVVAEQKAENEALRKAAREVLDWTEAKHRPPVADPLEHGRMALVRLHALADLHTALNEQPGDD